MSIIFLILGLLVGYIFHDKIKAFFDDINDDNGPKPA